MNNRYFYGSHLKERKFRQIVRLFSLDIEAKKTAKMTGVSRQSINKIYAAIRRRIVEICEEKQPPSLGEFELDESYFGARRIRGIRGRGAQGKTIVFGIMKRAGAVSAYVVETCSTRALMPLIKRHIDPQSTIYTDGFKTYESLPKFGYKNVLTVCHNDNEFAKENNIHTNTIENFWGLCKSRLFKFRGVSKNAFYAHLKECEFRYNNRGKNLYKMLLKNFRKNPLKLS